MTVNDMPVGAKLRFGTIRCGTIRHGGIRDINNYIDITWIKVSDECDFISDRSMNVVASNFDRREPDNPESARRNGGNNYFPHSNILQWLNASDADWYRPQHEYDSRPMSVFEGFLAGFDQWDTDHIVERDYRTLVPMGSRKELGKLMEVKAKVAIPSNVEVFGTEYHDDKTGEEQLKFFHDGGRLDYDFFTRTPYRDSRKALWRCDRWGGADWADATGYSGIAAMLRIQGDTPVQYYDGVYIVVKPNPFENILEILAAK